MMHFISAKTIERLSLYRRLLINEKKNNKKFIFSHELADLANTTSAQVRRDIMNIGYSGTPRKGYSITRLATCIGKVLDAPEGQNVCLVGVGNLGTAVLKYFSGKRPKLSIVAAFDSDPNKVKTLNCKVPCYDIENMSQIIKENNITIGIITAPDTVAAEVAELLIEGGVKSIVNFSSTMLHVPQNIFLEQIDITISLEKAAYFAKHLIVGEELE